MSYHNPLGHYYDFEGRPISSEQWGVLFADLDKRRVALTEENGWSVSTVWLGLDHRYAGEGPPLIFETMIFGTSLDEETHRYSTWAEAKAGHKRAVEDARMEYQFGRPEKRGDEADDR